jgi:outer membrane protein OmpA-like peptidoglycan-associated protein
MRAGLRIAATAATLLALSAGPAPAWDADKPDDPAAHAAARAAVAALGAGRGGRPVVSDTRDLRADVRELAGSGLALKAGVEDLDKAIKSLGAKVTETEIRVDVAADVLFDFDRADVKSAAEAELKRLALVIRQSRKGDVFIHGHTDAKGTAAYNQRLSERRADAVKTWLVTQGGIPAGVIKTKGYGQTKPVARNTRADGSDDPEGRARNRRVEVIIQTASKAR